MSEVASAFVTLIPSFRGGQAAIAKELDGPMRQAGNSSGGKFSGAFAVATKAGAATIGGALGTALFKGFNRLTAIEDAKAKLSGLGNSAKDVKSIMNDALASVKGTSFGLDEAATVAASSVAAGIKPGKQLESTLKLVADAATIGGTSLGEMGSIFNKVATSNKLQGDTINQLNERGIPIVQLLAKSMGKTSEEVVDLASKGKIGFADFSKAMESGLGGAALKSGETTTGAFKNMGAAIGRVGASLLSGVFPKLKGGFGSITAALDGIEPKAKIIGAAIGTGLMVAVDAVGTFVSVITSMVGFVNDNSTAFKALAIVITTLLAPALIMAGVQATISAAKQVAAWIASKVSAASSIALQTAGNVLIALGWARVGIAATLGAIQVAAAWLVSKLGAAGTILLMGVAFAFMAAGWLASGIAAMAGAVVVAAAWLLSILPIAIVVAAVIAIAALIIKNWDKIKSVVMGAVSAVIGFVKAHWPLLLAIIAGPIGLIVLAIVKNWAKIKSATSAAFNFVRSLITSVMGSVKSGVSNAIGAVVSIFKGLLGKIKGALSGAGSALKGIGKNIVQGLISGIKSMGGAIGRALVNLLPGPLKKFAGKLGINSPSKVFAAFGQNIGQGLVIGVDSTRGDVSAAAVRLSKSVMIPPAARFNASTSIATASTSAQTGGAMTRAELMAMLSTMKQEITFGLDRRTSAKIVSTGVAAGAKLA